MAGVLLYYSWLSEGNGGKIQESKVLFFMSASFERENEAIESIFGLSNAIVTVASDVNNEQLGVWST